MSIALDTNDIAQRLEKKGHFSNRQASAIVGAVMATIKDSHLATKSDVEKAEARLELKISENSRELGDKISENTKQLSEKIVDQGEKLNSKINSLYIFFAGGIASIIGTLYVLLKGLH